MDAAGQGSTRNTPAGQHESAPELPDAICCLIDHLDQYRILREALDDNDKPRSVFWFEAHCDDWPEMLARHLLLEPWPNDLNCLQRFVSGRILACDAERILDSWCEQLSLSRIAQRADRLNALHQWLNQAPLTVFYTELRPESWTKLPDYLRDAHQAVTQLGSLATGVRVVVLFACISSCRLPLLSVLLWRLHYRRRARKLSEAHELPGMCHLKKEDIADWHTAFPPALRPIFDHGQLKSEIFEQVFQQRDDPVRFQAVRRHLIDGKGLDRARKG